MSGHWRFCVAALFIVAGLSTRPAFSNPFTDLFNPAPQEAAPPAPAPAAAAAPAREQCLPQPGRSAPGQHWVYHLDGHRKCWYQADEATIAAKKQAQRRAARQPVVAAEESEAAQHKKRVADARAQLLSAATADAVQPTPPAPEVVDHAPVPAQAAAALVPAAPIVAEPTPDQPTLDQPRRDQPAPDHAARRPVDVEMLLAAAPPVGDAGASDVPPAAPAAPSVSDTMAPRAGLALIALGLVFLIVSLLASRSRSSRMAA